MSGSYVVAGSGGGAENRQRIRSSWAEPCPILEYLRIAEFGHEGDGSPVQTLNGGNVDALVESRFFHRCAHEQASVTSGDEISLGRSDDMLQQTARLHRQAEHLSLDWPGWKRMRPDLAGPRARAVHNLRCEERRLGRGDASGSSLRNVYCCNQIPRREVDAAFLCCFNGRRRQPFRIDAALLKVERRIVRRGECRLQCGETRQGQVLGSAFAPLVQEPFW